jgi:ABC-type antimicrobial peptide transport system permease subunit
MVQETGIKKQVALPLSKAFSISYQSLKIRFWRSIITIGGIFFAIAFLVSVLSGAVMSVAIAPVGEIETEGVGIFAVFTLLREVPRQAWLVSMSLLVSVIGIANAMLMSVTERYKEIGTMKCLGALDRFIVELFLLESGFQGLVGSVAGAVVGTLLVVLSNLISHGGEILMLISWVQLLVNVVMGIVIGVSLTMVGALYPSYRAAQMAPAEAMRTEV